MSRMITKTSNPGEALSTFIRASRDAKGDTQLRVAKSTKVGLLSTKTMPKHFPNNSKTTLEKSRKRHFRPPKLSKMTPQNGQNEHILHRKSKFLWLYIELWS